MTARIGAIPVPGPTQITDVVGSGGRVIKPFCKPTRRVSPFENEYEHEAKNSNGYLPGSKVARYDVHTPTRGALSIVRYLTMATHRCTWRGCFSFNSGFRETACEEYMTYFCETGDRELPRSQRREYVKYIISRDLH